MFHLGAQVFRTNPQFDCGDFSVEFWKIGRFPWIDLQPPIFVGEKHCCQQMETKKCLPSLKRIQQVETPENGLEYDPFLLGLKGLFSGALAVSFREGK